MKRRLQGSGLAMHGYLDKFDTFAARVVEGKAKKPLLSWRVSLLPFVNEQELYDRFHLDEPWDSPHNAKLIPQIPNAYRSGRSALDESGNTVFMLPVGMGTAFALPTGPKVKDFSDGLANTVLAVEAAEDSAVVWTKPEDLPYDASQPIKGLATYWIDGRRCFRVLLGDGVVEHIAMEESLTSIQGLFTRTGMEPPFKLR